MSESYLGGRCATLNPVYKLYVDFDPSNSEHIDAYRMLCLGEMRSTGIHICQHPYLRFNLQTPFVDVPSMMQHKVGTLYLTKLGQS